MSDQVEKHASIKWHIMALLWMDIGPIKCLKDTAQRMVSTSIAYARTKKSLNVTR